MYYVHTYIINIVSLSLYIYIYYVQVYLLYIVHLYIQGIYIYIIPVYTRTPYILLISVQSMSLYVRLGNAFSLPPQTHHTCTRYILQYILCMWYVPFCSGFHIIIHRYIDMHRPTSISSQKKHYGERVANDARSCGAPCDGRELYTYKY